MADTATQPTSATTEPTKQRRLSLFERTQILRMHKSGKAPSISMIAYAFGVHPSTVCRVIQSAEQEAAESARELMAAGVEDAIEDWEMSRRVAALKGDHRPSKDWLLHAGAIEPIDVGGATVNIGVSVISGTVPGLSKPSVPPAAGPGVIDLRPLPPSTPSETP